MGNAIMGNMIADRWAVRSRHDHSKNDVYIMVCVIMHRFSPNRAAFPATSKSQTVLGNRGGPNPTIQRHRDHENHQETTSRPHTKKKKRTMNTVGSRPTRDVSYNSLNHVIVYYYSLLSRCVEVFSRQFVFKALSSGRSLERTSRFLSIAHKNGDHFSWRFIL